MHWHMIDTVSNTHCEINITDRQGTAHRTRAIGTHAIHALTTRDTSQYTSDNIIVLE